MLQDEELNRVLNVNKDKERADSDSSRSSQAGRSHNRTASKGSAIQELQ